ncbi:MAG TPA: glutathione S-transferase family protein [Hyphomicrobiaceae bacterium]|nr:glutathione S-transferase family protein [Hyphomicrobiaceae bacterium]
MHKLTQFRLCPLSRSIRLALAELGIEVELIEERPWEQRPAFLAVNPAGELPVLAIEDGPLLCGAYVISEYLAEQLEVQPDGEPRVQLFPGGREERAEVRRLVDWFHGKLNREVTRELLHEKVYARLTPGPGQAPDPDILRAIRANLRYHVSYVSHLAHQRRWLAGDEMSFADFAAAAHVSSIDYLGEVAWENHPVAKSWYQRMKSRPAFRSILADRFPGTPPPNAYADLDF